MKQKTQISYWFLPVIILLLFVLAACVRPVPESEQPQITETPVGQSPIEETPIDSPSTPTPLPEVPAYPENVEPTPVEVTDPNTDGVAVTEPTAVPAGLPANHTVQANETLSSISPQYGVSADEIAAANNITTSSVLTVGQVLVIPAPGTTLPVVVEPVPPATGGEQTHTVQPGENLFRISLRYGKSVDEVAAYNGISNPHYIYPGQVIRIP